MRRPEDPRERRSDSSQGAGILLKQRPGFFTEHLLPLLVVPGPGYSSTERCRIRPVESETELLQFAFDVLAQFDKILPLLHRGSVEISREHLLELPGKRLPGTAIDQSELAVPHVVGDRNIFLNLV